MSAGPRVHRAVRRFALAYLVTSTYLVARLISNRLLLGTWGLGLQLIVETVAVSLLQLALVALFRLGRGPGSAGRAGAGGGSAAGEA